MLAALWLVADAAEEGRKVVLGMLVVGLVFIAVVLLGDGLNYLEHKRKRARANRPL
jgi:hypothetical protein